MGSYTDSINKLKAGFTLNKQELTTLVNQLKQLKIHRDWIIEDNGESDEELLAIYRSCNRGGI